MTKTKVETKVVQIVEVFRGDISILRQESWISIEEAVKVILKFTPWSTFDVQNQLLRGEETVYKCKDSVYLVKFTWKLGTC